MSTILLCKSENNMNINNNMFQANLKEIEPETIRRVFFLLRNNSDKRVK